MTQSAVPGSETFCEAFCRRYRCTPENFPKAVLRRSFPPWVTVPGSFLVLVKPSMFERELGLIQRLGALRVDSTGVRGELDGYAYENERDKPFRVETLHLRVSRRRILKLFREVLGVRTEPGAGGTGAGADGA